MPGKTRLRWREVERINHLPDLPVYHARVPGGYYRVAPVEYRDTRGTYSRLLAYEVFFIPDGATSIADTQDLAAGLARAEEAKNIAERDFDAINGGNGQREM